MLNLSRHRVYSRPSKATLLLVRPFLDRVLKSSFYFFAFLLFCGQPILAARSSDLILQGSQISEPRSESLKKCIHKAAGNLTAASRDLALFTCIQKHSDLRGEACVDLAQRFEYQSSSDQALSFCFNERVSRMSAETCHNFAKKFLFESNEDEARWTCLLNKVSSLNRSSCDRIASAIHSIPSKQRALEFCSARKP